jgi:hypothetical protein
MDALRVGDRVLAARADGSTFYDDVYMFGHKDAAAAAQFVHLETATGAALRLTPDHYVPLVRDGQPLLLPSSRAAAGDLVRVASAGGAAALERIVSKSLVQGRGLFNPYTLSGAIVVDGLSASCHSAYFLDGVFAAVGVHPAAGFQAVNAPVRALYRLLGARGMTKLAPIIDAVVDACNRGPAAVLAPAAASVCSVLAVAALAARKRAA